MLIFIAIAAALLPMLLLLFYIYRQDSANPEPARLLWKGVGYGVLSTFLTLCILIFYEHALPESPDGSVYDAFLSAFFGAAFPEETAKFIMLWLLIRKNPYFDEHLDGIVYAACVGLGFAGFENVFYLLDNMDSLVATATMRALFSVPGHFFFAVAMGYFVSKARFASESFDDTMKYYFFALAVPFLLHGIFDFILMIPKEENLLWMLLFFPVFVIFNHKLRKKALKRILEMKVNDGLVEKKEFTSRKESGGYQKNYK